MPLHEENPNEFPSAEGDADNINKQDNDDTVTANLLPLRRNRNKPGYDFGVGLDFDGLMKKYLIWTYEQPLKSRCIASAITAFLGALLARATTTAGNKSKLSARNQNQKRINMLEVISFAVHGGLVAGPLSHYIDRFLKQQRQKSKNSLSLPRNSSSTYDLLIDQVIMAPPKLYLTFLVVDVTRTLLESTLPNASRKSFALLASALGDSLRFWPLSIYVLLKFLKKRRHYAAAINLCSIAFSMHLAKKRNKLKK